ncbi:MAG: hypothetical protein K2X69_03670 [Silvanigrellaceae bacterium]|nr:hypothetical protein [Silvanigrellaceae bacterium]
MTTASTMTDLNGIVGNYLGSTYTKFDVFAAKEILFSNGYTLGQYSTDENKWARLDNINDFWPDNMIDLINKYQQNYELKTLGDYIDLAKICLEDYSNKNDLDDHIEEIVESKIFKADIDKLFNDKASANQVSLFFHELEWDEKYLK